MWYRDKLACSPAIAAAFALCATTSAFAADPMGWRIYDPIAASLTVAGRLSVPAKPIRALMCSARYSASRATPENRPEPQV